MYKQGYWSAEEDEKLSNYMKTHSEIHWNDVPIHTGLPRDGEGCRWRWVNYLRPGLTKGPFSEEEVKIVIYQHQLVGNRWVEIAKHLPGRTDNDVKIFWEAHTEKEDKLKNEDMNADVNVNIKSSSSVNKSESPKGKEVAEMKETVSETTNNEEMIGDYNELEDNNAWSYEVEAYHMYLSLMNIPSTSSEFEEVDDCFNLWNLP